MAIWHWTTTTWECDACGATTNRPLAHFCSQCGEPATDKVTSVAAPIASAEDRSPEERTVPLRNPDLLLNIFGVALVVEKATGNMVVFPDPLCNDSSFELPRISKGIAQVRFDPWWVYVLDTQGTLFVFPVSALSPEYMAPNTGWQRCAEGVHKFWLLKKQLLVLDKAGRQLKIGAIPSLSHFWAEDEEIICEPSKMETPFEVETLVPLRGEDFLLALIGKNQMALLSDEGVSDLYDEFLGDGGDHWIGLNRAGMLRLASRQGNGEVRVVSFTRDPSQKILQDTIPDLSATALHTIDISGQDWFVVVTSDNINLVDPLTVEKVQSYEVFMERTDMCASFGNLFAGFEKNEDPGGSPLVSLFHFDRHDISRPHAWFFDDGLIPVTAPAGFGQGVYVLMKERNNTKLYCYSLSGKGEA